MKIEKLQLLLGYLDYYDLRRKDGSLAIDGLDGPATEAAVRQFQVEHRQRPDGTDLWIDGIPGPATERAILQVIGTGEEPQVEEPEHPHVPVVGYKWFDYEDLHCRCGGRYCTGWPAKPHKKTLQLLDQIGDHFQGRIHIHSGLRCKQWNAHEGGAPGSKHCLGMAVDFHIDGVSPQQLADYAETLMPGWGGIGIYNWGIHLDDRPVKGRWRG